MEISILSIFCYQNLVAQFVKSGDINLIKMAKNCIKKLN